ncbi:uncharacterized protein LOC128739676 [Sabethes cyaneus]|uniref:uncharacterized protein LOC128739676 n=1 Tax=Sabethes cyaneus TaxID=53552 RepID=UPI00237DCF82|nr:uncharacterized protein LOC128739676 [Sabethes cyaneus]
MTASDNTADCGKWLRDEHRRVNEEISVHKKRQEELARRMKQIRELLNNRGAQLDTMKKRCEETRLLLTELTANEKRIAAFHELEKLRYSKIQHAVDEHKASILRLIHREEGESHNEVKTVDNIISHDQSTYVCCNRGCTLDEKIQFRSDLERSLVKREQELTIRRNHNAARIVRLRKLLHSHEAKRALCKEQLSALKAKANRRY